MKGLGRYFETAEGFSLDPGATTRFFLSLVVVPVIAMVPSDKWQVLLALVPLVVFFIITLRVSLREVLRFSLFILPVATLVVIPVFYGGRGELEHWGAGRFRVSYYPDSMDSAAIMIGRSFLALFAAVSLLHGVKFIEFVSIIERMRVPAGITVAFSIAVNFMGSLQGEARKLLLARKARAVRSSYWIVTGLSAGAVAVLFLRCIRTAENLHRAMIARGFSGRTGRVVQSPGIRFEYFALVLAYVVLARTLFD